jgi:hypothetical protein
VQRVLVAKQCLQFWCELPKMSYGMCAQVNMCDRVSRCCITYELSQAGNSTCREFQANILRVVCLDKTCITENLDNPSCALFCSTSCGRHGATLHQQQAHCRVSK